MLSISDIVSWGNEKINPLIPKMKAYGIAKTAVKDDKILPYIDEVYIGIDDTFEAQVYHKQLTINSTTVPRSGYGDSNAYLQNTYGMAMFIYFNEKKCGIKADELYTYIQSIITGVLKAEGYKSIRVNVLNAILNDASVWTQEYGQTPFRLAGSQRLIQINYNIVMVFETNCITIPNCKN